MVKLICLFLMLQSRIIRTTELAAAQEKLHELEKQKEELLKFYSPASLLQKLQGDNANKLIFPPEYLGLDC